MSVIHMMGDHQATMCGQWAAHEFRYTTVTELFRAGVYETGEPFNRCRRCLASLAKRDRAFQRKARKGMNASLVTERQWLSMFAAWKPSAAEAIAREEGRAL